MYQKAGGSRERIEPSTIEFLPFASREQGLRGPWATYARRHLVVSYFMMLSSTLRQYIENKYFIKHNGALRQKTLCNSKEETDSAQVSTYARN